MQILQNFETIPDAELIKRINEGETQLFEILIRRNNPFLYKIGMSYGYNHQDVQDLMQEAFISAFVNLPKFENRSTFKTWITRIMLNGCHKKAQKMSFKNEKTMDNSFNENLTPAFQHNHTGDAYKTVINKELSHVIGTALNTIPLDYRMVFSLRELNGMSTAETAEALDISETNVKVRLNRAKHMLRNLVEKLYSPAEIFEFNLTYCDSMVNKVMKEIKNCNS